MNAEPLVVPMHVPRSGRFFMPLSILITVGFVLWMALDWSWESSTFGLLWVLSMIFVWGIVVTNRRVLGGRPMQLVADATGIRTAMWSVGWDQVDRMGVGSVNGIRAVIIAMSDPNSIERPPSVVYSAASRIDQLFGLASIKILEANIDRSAEVLLEQLEAKAPSYRTRGAIVG